MSYTLPSTGIFFVMNLVIWTTLLFGAIAEVSRNVSPLRLLSSPSYPILSDRPRHKPSRCRNPWSSTNCLPHPFPLDRCLYLLRYLQFTPKRAVRFLILVSHITPRVVPDAGRVLTANVYSKMVTFVSWVFYASVLSGSKNRRCMQVSPILLYICF